MKIAIIGPGSMGLLYGAYLSKSNEVFLFGKNSDNMNKVAQFGITVNEKDGSTANYKVFATANPNEIGVVDLAIVFVKAYNSMEALNNCKEIIGNNTILMTLQNGLGNEAALLKFACKDNIIVGNTNQGSSRNSCNEIYHSGLGDTFLGVVSGEASRFENIRANFEKCGFPCEISNDVKKVIWNKLMINASSSVLSGILQTPQGYVVNNQNAFEIAKKLIDEMCQVATADGYMFDKTEQLERLKNHLLNAPDGLTSIYSDIKNGRKTEVDMINGAVVSIAKQLGINVPTHENVVNIVKAMECRTAKLT